MKSYYIFYPRNFANEYSFWYADNPESKKSAKALENRTKEKANCDFHQIMAQEVPTKIKQGMKECPAYYQLNTINIEFIKTAIRKSQ